MPDVSTANDLFISYANIDDLPISEDQKGWITEFHRILENRLAQLMGEKQKYGATKNFPEVTYLMTRLSINFETPS